MSAPFGSLPTRWDPDAGPSDHVAVVLPGAAYSPSHPLLEFGRQALLQHGWTVQQVWWDWPAGREATTEARLAFVADEARTALNREAAASRLMVLAKSLGTLASPVAAERGLPGVWLTPLFDVPVSIDAIASAAAGNDEHAPAPQLLVGGLNRRGGGGLRRSVPPVARAE